MKLENLTTNDLGRHCIYLDEVDSTNEYLKREGASLPHGTLVLAGCQTAGKGRLGRRWAATDRDALAMSLLLRDFDVQRLSALPLVSGMAVAQGLREMTGGDFGIKWTNDVVAQGKKVCGILCESRLMGSGAFAVCGIGVNLIQNEDYFHQRELPYATSVRLATGVSLSPDKAAAAIMNGLEPLYQSFARAGFASLREEYRRQCVTLGRQVRVTYGGETREGEALDVAEDGNLICRIGGGLVKIAAGEASVRGMYGYV